MGSSLCLVLHPAFAVAQLVLVDILLPVGGVVWLIRRGRHYLEVPDL